jgi:EAL and modified HD-GYP domain-containing signal transduction protein
MRDVFVGRQAIFDRRRKVVGWELLFRNETGARGDIGDGNHATASTLLAAIVEIGLERVAGGEPIFINCPREFLETRTQLLPPERCVLEVLEDIEPNAALLNAVDRLRAERYTIALDDFVFTPDLAPLVERAHIVKIDVRALGMAGVTRQVAMLRPFGVQLLAEKVETEEEVDACGRLGFTMFQGYYLRRPETLQGKTVKLGQSSALLVMAECRNENADLSKITRIISSDVALSYKMLQLANSALFHVRSPVESIPQAVSVLGLDALGRWCSLLLLSGIDRCPPSYLQRAVERGRMCELLARTTSANHDSAYLTGLLSILDSVLQSPIAQLTPQLPLGDDIKEALEHRSGELGRLLQAVLSYEAAEPVELVFPLPVLERCFWEATAYARATTERLGLATEG